MAEVVFTVGHTYAVQDVIVTSNRGRQFTIDIVEVGANRFGVWLLIDDPLGVPRIKFFQYPKASDDTASENFLAAAECVLAYLRYADEKDSVEKVNNPCNAQFLSAPAQEAILRQLGVPVIVTVNAH